MIRLVRGAEPEALRDKRPSKLVEVRARRTAGDVVKLTGYGDDGVKDRLDRPGLIELYNKHVRDFVRPAIDHFIAVAKTEDARVIVDAWSRLRRRLDAPGQAFRALSRDAAETLTPQYVRTQYRLTL